MSQPAYRPERIVEESRRLARNARPWVVVAARAGHAAKGTVYVLVGALSAAAAVGRTARPADSDDAFALLLGTTAGPVLVLLIALGLLAYAAWQLIRAATDADHEGSDVKGIVSRLSDVVSGVVYGAFAFVAGTMAMTGPGPGGDAQARDLTATVMAQPLGRWIVGVTGIVMVIGGALRIRRGWRGDLGPQLRLGELSDAARRAAIRFGRIGFAAQGIVIAIIGAFLVVATVELDPAQARGMGGALAAVAQQPYGRWLLGAMALGLVYYGLFELVRARYRSFRVG
jgi:uncharacterized protein DUF1206